AEARAEADELAALLLRLPSTLRAAVILRHVDGLSVAETAEALGRPEGTIKAHVSRGLERLRALLLSADVADGVGAGDAPLPAAQTNGTSSIHSPPRVASMTPVLPRRASAAPEVLR
ncbi:MAG TPA: RNA polymerase sigma factor, partial [Candidatus Limnocylindrales bacterium]